MINLGIRLKKERKKQNKNRLMKFYEKEHTKINCECGGTYYSYQKARHNKIKKHQKFVQRSESQ